MNLLWLFPWSIYFPSVAGLSYKHKTARTHASSALCWTGFLLLFFTFSTTQEYYSMPIYPALALLLGSALASGHRWLRTGTKMLATVCSAGNRGGRVCALQGAWPSPLLATFPARSNAILMSTRSRSAI